MSASAGKLEPSTAASATNERSCGSRASSRAASRACRLSRDRQFADIADQPVDPVDRDDDVAVDQRADRLDGEQRVALRLRRDRRDGRRRHARHERVDQRVHRAGVERVEGEARCGCGPAPSRGASFVELGTGQHEHEDRRGAGPVDEVVEEVEQGRVGVLRVLDQQHHRADVGQSLEEQPPAGEQLLAAERGVGVAGIANAEQPGEPRADVDLFGRVRDELRQPRGQLAGGDLGRVLLGDAEPLSHDLGERPERDTVAVGQAPALVPEDRLGQAVDVLAELPAQPRLADAGRPGDQHQPRAAPFGARVQQLLDVRSSASRPRNGASRPSTRCEPPTPERTRVARHSRAGSALPLSACSPASSKPTEAAARRWVASSTSTVPGCAADCTRAAVFTASPATMPSPVAPSVTATSPVTTPARAASPVAPTRSPSAATAATTSSAARTARSASPSVAIGVPHTAITASPMNFSTTPP